jgi:hypothetical protein
MSRPVIDSAQAVKTEHIAGSLIAVRCMTALLYRDRNRQRQGPVPVGKPDNARYIRSRSRVRSLIPGGCQAPYIAEWVAHRKGDSGSVSTINPRKHQIRSHLDRISNDFPDGSTTTAAQGLMLRDMPQGALRGVTLLVQTLRSHLSENLISFQGAAPSQFESRID